MPDWLKADLMANADQRFYTPDSNNDQIMRSWERFQTEGYEAMRDRLLQQEGHLLTADDVQTFVGRCAAKDLGFRMKDFSARYVPIRKTSAQHDVSSVGERVTD